MAGAIQKEDIINIAGLDGDVTKAIQSLKSIALAATELSKSLGDTKGLKDLTTALKTLNQVQNEFAKFQTKMIEIAVRNEKLATQEAKTKQENIKLLEQEEKVRTQVNKTKVEGSKITLNETRTEKILNTEKKETVKLTTEQRLAAQLLLKEEKLRITIANSQEGSFDKLNAQYQLNIIALQKMSQEQRTNSQAAKDLVKENNILVGKLNSIDTQTGRTKRSFNGLQWQVTQLARELPSLAYGANVFFGAIGNNLPMLIDEMKALSAANKIAAAEGRATVPVWKQIAGSIFNWQTAIIIAITALTLYGRELSAWTKELFKGRDAINSLSEAMNKKNKIAKELGVEMAKEKTAMKLNFLVANDITRSYEERLAAANKLISKYPEILGNYTTEQLLTSNLTGIYRDLTDAIEKSFEARFAEEKILENYREMAKQQKIIENGGTMWGKFSRLTVNYTKDLDGAKNKIIQIKEENRKLFEQFNVTGDDQFGIKAASNEFEIYSKLQSKETRKIFDERSGFVSKDAQTYRQWLTNQLVVYKDNIDAKIALEQELATFIEKDEKKQESEAVKKAKAKLLQDIRKNDHKIWLDSEKQAYDDLEDERKKDDKKIKDGIDEVADIRKYINDKTLSDAESEIHEEMMLKITAAGEEIKNAKGNADKIRDIQDKLEIDLLESERRILQAKLDSGLIIGNDAEQIQKRINSIEEGTAKKKIDITTKSDEEKRKIAQETMQATNELLQQGLEFSQQIFSAQLSRAEETYNAEYAAAAGNLELETIAKRKHEAEDKKIKQRQAIASKLQAVMTAGLNLALAIATTWANPLLAALNIAAASTGLAMALATPIPQFAEGVESSPDTFIAGEEGSELIKTKSGKMILTPNKATLFSDSSLSGSTVFPRDETQRMLANMAFNQVREVVDMSKTESYLSSMDKQMKNKTERYTDAKGRTVVKRGTLISTL